MRTALIHAAALAATSASAHHIPCHVHVPPPCASLPPPPCAPPTQPETLACPPMQSPFDFNLCMMTCRDRDTCGTCIPGTPSLETQIDAIACYRRCKNMIGSLNQIQSCFDECYDKVKEGVEACESGVGANLVSHDVVEVEEDYVEDEGYGQVIPAVVTVKPETVPEVIFADVLGEGDNYVTEPVIPDHTGYGPQDVPKDLFADVLAEEETVEESYGEDPAIVDYSGYGPEEEGYEVDPVVPAPVPAPVQPASEEAEVASEGSYGSATVIPVPAPVPAPEGGYGYGPVAPAPAPAPVPAPEAGYGYGPIVPAPAPAPETSNTVQPTSIPPQISDVLSQYRPNVPTTSDYTTDTNANANANAGGYGTGQVPADFYFQEQEDKFNEVVKARGGYYETSPAPVPENNDAYAQDVEEEEEFDTLDEEELEAYYSEGDFDLDDDFTFVNSADREINIVLPEDEFGFDNFPSNTNSTNSTSNSPDSDSNARGNDLIGTLFSEDGEYASGATSIAVSSLELGVLVMSLVVLV